MTEFRSKCEECLAESQEDYEEHSETKNSHFLIQEINKHVSFVTVMTESIYISSESGKIKLQVFRCNWFKFSEIPLM